ncbi:MAG: glycosyltransferase [Nanoarchaeota archaeon]|mgnify:CR=1 FL=1
MKLNVYGAYFGGTSGYTSHIQQLCLALSKHVELGVETAMPPDWMTMVNDKTLPFFSKNFFEETTLSITQPWSWSQKLADKPKKFIGFLVWEGDKIPKSWIKSLEDKRVNQIWVPSNHTRDAISNTTKNEDILNKLRIVPHGVNTEIFKPAQNLKKDYFTFVANKGWKGGWNDRGGLQYVFKAFKEEFNKSEKVKCLVKLNNAYNSPFWNWRAELNKLGINPNGADILVNVDPLPYKGLLEIYNSGDCFVCPSRAESFGLTMAEAMACGLPVITTNYGGQTDFINNENGWLIGGKEEPANDDLIYEGVNWLTPNIEELRKTMRYCFNNQEEVKNKGKKALEKIKEFTWEESAKKAYKCLQELE